MSESDLGIVPIKTALISASDKTGLKDLAACLVANGIRIISTGGTAQFLRMQCGASPVEDSDYTGFSEIMDGRVKTLHPMIFGSILGRGTVDAKAMASYGMLPIDLVVVNLYPFEEAVAAGKRFDECIEQIDVGGPALIRAAAKNHERVAVVTDPVHYPALIKEIRVHEGLDRDTRTRLAALAFSTAARYDEAISRWLHRQSTCTPFFYTLQAA